MHCCPTVFGFMRAWLRWTADTREVSVEAGAGMTRRAALAQFGGALASGMLATGCGVLWVGGGTGKSGTPEATGSPTPQLLWTRPVGDVDALLVTGGVLSLGTEAVNAATGTLRWSIGSGVTRPSAAFGAGGGMILCSGTGADGDDNITALSAATGRVLWTAPSYVGNPSGGPGPWLTFADGAVYALIGLPGSHQVQIDNVVLALDGRTGARKWMTRLPPMARAMAVADGGVYAGSALGSQSASGSVVALDGATGARRWTATVAAPVGALAVTAGVVAGCWDDLAVMGKPLMFGLNPADGRILWQRDVDPVLSLIAAAGGLVFALDLATGALLAVDALTGDLRWKQPGGQYPSAPVVSGDAVCVGYQDSVRAYSARTGQPLWSYPAKGLFRNLAASGGILYAAGEDPYTLYALRV